VFRQVMTVHKGRWVALVATVSLAVGANPASSQTCEAPPGMSAIEQYCEATPAPGGDRGPDARDLGGVPVAPEVRRALERAGAGGQAILALSGATGSPRGAQGDRPPGGNAGSTRTEVSAPDDGGDPIQALTAVLDDPGATVAPLFGTILLSVALFFFGSAWLRYRRRAES
jgi:hypothetical protein